MIVKLNTTVADKRDSSIVGILTRRSGDIGYVMPAGAKEPLKIKLSNLIAVKIGRPAKGSAPANEKKDNTIRHDLTPKVEIKITGTIRGQNWEAIRRSFPTVKEAQAYLKMYKITDIKGKHAKVAKPAEADVETNYDIASILEGVAPKDLLPVILKMEAAGIGRGQAIVMPTRVTPSDTSADTTAIVGGATPITTRGAKIKHASKSGLIPLKQICRELDLDAREARMKLRSLTKKGTISHQPQGRWEWAPEHVEDIKAQLKGGTVKPTKAEVKAATPVIEEIVGAKVTAKEATGIVSAVKKSKVTKGKQPHPAIKKITFKPSKGKDIAPPASKKKLIVRRGGKK